MLLDEKRFALDEPITDWMPEFAHMRVLRSRTGSLNETDPAQRAITFEDLLTHRSGLTYGSFHTGPIADASPRRPEERKRARLGTHRRLEDPDNTRDPPTPRPRRRPKLPALQRFDPASAGSAAGPLSADRFWQWRRRFGGRHRRQR
jgi:CubicO group peptidase (beta-lactamase class C family)